MQEGSRQHANTQQTNSGGTPQLPQPCSGLHRTVCKQIAEPWGCVTGRKNWPPRSHFPSLVSYRLDHIHWKSVCSSLWTQGYWKRWTAPNNLLLRADTPTSGGQGWLLDRVLALPTLELRPPYPFSFMITRFQSKKAPEGN